MSADVVLSLFLVVLLYGLGILGLRLSRDG